MNIKIFSSDALFIYLRIFTEDKHFSTSTVINMCPLYNYKISTLIIIYFDIYDVKK